MRNMLIAASVMAGIMFGGCGAGAGNDTNESNGTAADTLDPKKVALGERLFNDKHLSRTGHLACASCHDADHAFSDPRTATAQNDYGAVSIGDDNLSLGDRNAPSAMYAMFTPVLHYDDSSTGEDGLGGTWLGGQFRDGRARDLKTQAKGPFLNPVEMQMATPGDVITRVRKNATYVSQFKTLYGDDIFENNTSAYDAIGDAIATFEKSARFAPFDSKYDRYLAGEATLTDQEREGLDLFVRADKGNCAFCHPAAASGGNAPLFTDAGYDNLGVPVNESIRNNPNNPLSQTVGYRDIGLGQTTGDATVDGAFKVPTLRNVAVTGPYMHNGVFKTLKAVVHFYNTRDVTGAINPETGLPWRTPEVPETVNTAQMGDLNLTDDEENAIVAFLKTLTDARYASTSAEQ